MEKTQNELCSSFPEGSRKGQSQPGVVVCIGPSRAHPAGTQHQLPWEPWKRRYHTVQDQASRDGSILHPQHFNVSLIRTWNSLVKPYKISLLRSSPGINHHKRKIFPNTTQLHHPRACTQTTSTDFCLTCSPNSYPTGFPNSLSFHHFPESSNVYPTTALILAWCLPASLRSHGEKTIVVPFKATFPILDDSFPSVFLG